MSKGGKLVNDVRNSSGSQVRVIFSHGAVEETVVLKGPAESVDRAEQMLEELWSSALEISITGEESAALLTGGKNCIMYKIQRNLQVPLSLEGHNLLLFGKPEETKKAKEMAAF